MAGVLGKGDELFGNSDGRGWLQKVVVSLPPMLLGGPGRHWYLENGVNLEVAKK